ncbi:hypothetical protein [Bergeyella sp. RCAD1439]|uniref:hypothetical protein n=1 Tax=Bergeyella anatis TaxID=3113737 RepID=UPI002E17FE8B|nr:hypothetical protein [Bergeyella sp. RCAD1439]
MNTNNGGLFFGAAIDMTQWRKDLKKYTIGKIISIILILLLSYPFFDIYYKVYFFKNNVKKDLNILNFQLNDDFEILGSVGSDNFLGKSQITTIEISNEDKLRLIDQIVQSKNYKELKDENESNIAYDKAYPPEYFLTSNIQNIIHEK